MHLYYISRKVKQWLEIMYVLCITNQKHIQYTTVNWHVLQSTWGAWWCAQIYHLPAYFTGVDKLIRLWGWDVEYCCTLYFYGRLSKYLHNYMHLRTPHPFVYTLASSLGSEFSSSESRAERTTPPLVFGFASHESTADKYVWCSPTWAGIQLS